MPGIEFTNPHEINITFQTQVRLYKTDTNMTDEAHERRTNELVNSLKMMDCTFLPIIFIDAASNGAFDHEGIVNEYTTMIASRPLKANVEGDIQDLGSVGIYYGYPLVSTSASVVVPQHPTALANMFFDFYKQEENTTIDMLTHPIRRVGSTFDKLWTRAGLQVRPTTKLGQFSLISLKDIEDTTTGATAYTQLMVTLTDQVYKILGILATLFVDRYGGVEKYNTWKEGITAPLALDELTFVPKTFSDTEKFNANVLENLYLVIQNHVIAVLMSSTEGLTKDVSAIKQVLSDLTPRCTQLSENPTQGHNSEGYDQKVISHYANLVQKAVIRESDYNSFLMRMFIEDEPKYENLGRYNAALVSADLCDAFSVFQGSKANYKRMERRLSALQDINVPFDMTPHLKQLYHMLLMNIINLAGRIDLHWERYRDKGDI